MKNVICNNKEDFLKITNLLLKNGYVLHQDFYNEEPIFSLKFKVVVCIYDLKIINWTYTSEFDIKDMVYAKDVINDLRKEKLNKII